MALRILKHDLDGGSGLMTFRVRVEDADGAGSEETIAIYPRALAAIHGEGEMTEETIHAAIMRWLKPRHEEMMDRHRLKQRFAQAAQKLTGQTITFD